MTPQWGALTPTLPRHDRRFRGHVRVGWWIFPKDDEDTDMASESGLE